MIILTMSSLIVWHPGPVRGVRRWKTASWKQALGSWKKKKGIDGELRITSQRIES
jgi:hypothetical protein